MRTLLDQHVPRALDELVRQPPSPGTRLDAWVFEDEPARRDAEARLADAGVAARLRSAYKPLLHFFLEEAELAGLTAATVQTPSHPLAAPGRFELEAYPLAGLLRGAVLRFEPGSDPLHHRVVLQHGARRTEHRVFAPNRERRNPLGDAVLAPCGWLRMADRDAPLDTEYEAAFAAVMELLAREPWPDRPPYFDALSIRVDTAGIEHRLFLGDECASTGEALHEDLYFSVLEHFQHRAGLPPGDRTLRLGQVVPDVRRNPPGHPSAPGGTTRVRVMAGSPDAPPAFRDGDQDLEEADRPLDPAQIQAELRALGGTRFDVASHRGRPVLAVVVPGREVGLVVSAGQHANETSGTVGALRAARVLKGHGIGFALIPQENPDGYALHRALRGPNPRHMHHAARFTALGDDLAFRTEEPFIEAAARRDAYRRVGAVLHVNLHGYPAHEWTRPHTGYVPRGSGQWAIPQGFFFILNHRPGLREHAGQQFRWGSVQPE